MQPGRAGGVLVDAENPPTVVHFPDSKLPAQLMALDEVDSGYPCALRQAEIVNQYGVAHAHLVKRIAAQGRNLLPGLGWVNFHYSVVHTHLSRRYGSYCVNRHRFGELENRCLYCVA